MTQIESVIKMARSGRLRRICEESPNQRFGLVVAEEILKEQASELEKFGFTIDEIEVVGGIHHRLYIELKDFPSCDI